MSVLIWQCSVFELKFCEYNATNSWGISEYIDVLVTKSALSLCMLATLLHIFCVCVCVCACVSTCAQSVYC